MSSLIFCLKQTCDQILVMLKIRKRSPKIRYEGDDTYDERQKITLNSWRGEEEQKPTRKQRQQHFQKQKNSSKQQQKKLNEIKPSISDSLVQQFDLLMKEQPLQPLPQATVVSAKEPQSLLLNTQSSHSLSLSSQKPLKQHKPISISTQSFKINLQSYDSFYEMIQKKTQHLQEKLNTPSAVIDIQKSTSQLQIRHAESQKLNIFIYQFRLPCTYSFYSSMLNNYGLQKKIDQNIDEFKMLELYANNLRLNYLSYKKVLIVSPRDFVYLKYTNNVDNQYWDISFSIPWEQTPGKIRGQIVLNASKIIEKEESIEVQVYTQVDMKLSLKAKITKNQAVNEIKRYVEKCQRHVRQNYRRQFL